MHDKIALDVKHIRLMNIADGKISLILSMGFFQTFKEKFREVYPCTMKDGKEIVVEVVPLGAGECFTLRARMNNFRG